MSDTSQQDQATASAIPAFRYAYGIPDAKACLKATCDDFIVHEDLGFELDGHGEHVCVYIEKRDQNTADIALALQRLTKVSSAGIGYCGLKDRRAVTRQWFSVHCGVHMTPDWTQLESDNLRVLDSQRHSKKLRIGSHRANYFSINLCGLSCPPAELEARLQQIKTGGFPNYFGEQRFGYNGANIAAAHSMFERLKKRRQRTFKARGKDGFLLSASRALLFNRALSDRIEAGLWNRAIDGDVLQLESSNSVFSQPLDDTLQNRVIAGELHPTGPLHGIGGLQPQGAALALERKAMSHDSLLADGLEDVSMRAARRALRALAIDLSWRISAAHLQLEFGLRRGSYATSLIREIVQATAR